MSDNTIEQQLIDKGLTAARVTPVQIDYLMSQVTYWVKHVEGTTNTIAIALDANKFPLASEISGCASPENFDAEIGEQIALSDCKAAAREELWRLEGYKLKREISKPRVNALTKDLHI